MSGEIINYAILVISSSVQPEVNHATSLLLHILPELNARYNKKAQVALLWDTIPISKVNIPELAIKTFGIDLADHNKNTYRTISYSLKEGEAKCFVVYSKSSPDDGLKRSIGDFKNFSSPKDLPIVCGKTASLSVYAQHYLKIIDASNYDSAISVIIVEEPHYDTLGQWSVFRGLSIFLSENPILNDYTAFLTEGIKAHKLVDVKPIQKAFPNPTFYDVYNALDTYMISAQTAYAWKYGNIRVYGTEDEALYHHSAQLWTDERYEEWLPTVVVRNRTIAKTAIDYSYAVTPFLFVGSLHNERYPIFRTSNLLNNVITSNAKDAQLRTKLSQARNEGILDLFREQGIGYICIAATMHDPSYKLIANQNKYRHLFQAQLSKNYAPYYSYLHEHYIELGVTISQAPNQFIEFCQNNSSQTSNDQKLDHENDGSDGDGDNNDNDNDDFHEDEDQDDDQNDKPKDNKKGNWLHRSGDAKRKEKKQIRDAAKNAGIKDKKDQAEFGKHVESYKVENKIPNYKNLDFKTLQGLAAQFASFFS